MMLTTRLARCLACAAVVLATVTSSSAFAAPAKPRAKTTKVVAKEKAPAARHPFKKAKSAAPKAKPKKAKPAKPGPHPSSAPHGESTHPAPLAA